MEKRRKDEPRLRATDCTKVNLDLSDLTDEKRIELLRMLTNQRVTVVERTPHPVEELRPCKGKVFNNGEAHEVTGRFHGWGSDCVEFESGGCTYSTAIIELDDGKVVACNADTVQFLDR